MRLDKLIHDRQTSVDLFVIMILIVMHPAVYSLGETLMYFPPDTIGYVTFARDYLSQGLLYLERGLSGSGSILPPVYPLLVLASSLCVDDMLLAAEYVSKFSAIATSLIFYLTLRRWSRPYFAFAAVMALQLNYDFVYMALTPLTESSFLLVLSCIAWLIFRETSQKRHFFSMVVIGALLGVAFLTRQLGIIVAPYALLFLSIATPRRFVFNTGAIVLGMACLILPYATLLKHQGNEMQVPLSMFEQHWTKRESISLRDVEQDVQEYLQKINDKPVHDYMDLLQKRRLLRQLLPDSSALLSEISEEPVVGSKRGILRIGDRVWSSVGDYDDHVSSNVSYLVESLGVPILVVFVITLITPCIFKAPQIPFLARYFVGGFVLYYLLVISLLTGLVERYVLILSPLVLLHILFEFYCLILRWGQKENRRFVVAGLYTLGVALIVLVQPKSVDDISSLSRDQYATTTLADLGEFRGVMDPGAKVFAMYPLHAFLAGGDWRILPNDSLEKISKFAEHEGVEWLLVVREESIETSLNEKTRQWYMGPHLPSRYKHLMEMQAVTRNGRAMLFRFN